MIIVNFSTRQYALGQERLNRSLSNSNHPGTFGYNILMINDYSQINSPTHQQSPYEFKIHAIEKAMEYDPVVLWCDSSMVVVNSLTPIEQLIYRDGYFMEEAGHYVKTWCKPETREYFKLTPEEDNFTMFSAGLLGLNFNNPVAVEWFRLWKKSAKDGHFKGDWSNHRHDMTCGSIIAQRMGFKYSLGGTYMAYIGPGYSKPKDSVVIHCVGL